MYIVVSKLKESKILRIFFITICGWLKNSPPKDIHTLIPGMDVCSFIRQHLCRCGKVKDPEMELLWSQCFWPQNSYVEILMPNVMVLGSGVFGSLDHEGGALMNRISVLVKETPQKSLAPSTTSGHSEKLPSTNQEMGPHQLSHQISCCHNLRLTSLWNCEK